MQTSYQHRGSEEPLLGSTLPAHIRSVAERFPSHEALICLAQGKRLTYTELMTAVDQLGLGLLGLGFRKGDRIGIWATNNREWLLIQLATARIGAILVNLNPAYRLGELAHALACAEIQGLFTIPSFRSSDYVSLLTELIPELSFQRSGDLSSERFAALRRVIVYEPAGPDDTRRPAPGFTIWPELIEAGKGIAPEQLEAATAALDFDDPINIQYTVPSSGLPKAVLLSHHNLLNNAYFSARELRFTAQDRLCIPLPFFHCFGMVLGNLLCLSVGACIVIPAEYFDPLAVLQAIEAERCTAVHGVPTMFLAELEHPRFPEFDLSSLRTGIMGGAPCPPALMRRVMEDMHCREILIGYGQTEASPLTHLTRPDDSLEQRTETVGRNLPHQEVKIVQPGTGRIVPRGEVGEVCFRGYHLMQGYHGDPDATAKAIDDHGWLHSGDLGRMDARGYLKITGRLKDMIIRGGENIYPREIEDLLRAHPKVSQAAVIGVADPYYGEEIMAWVTLREGQAATEEELREYCQGRIAHYKVPRHIRFLEELPMTGGEACKDRLREMALEMGDKTAAPG